MSYDICRNCNLLFIQIYYFVEEFAKEMVNMKNEIQDIFVEKEELDREKFKKLYKEKYKYKFDALEEYDENEDWVDVWEKV